MSKLWRISAAITALAVASSLPLATVANIEDLPGMDTAATMQEWLKLTEDQVAKLEPVIETRITKVDAALAKVEAAEEPDAIAFIEEYGAAKTEFNAGVTNILTPQQLTQWETFKAELENELVQAGASKQLLAMQPGLSLTDEQVTKLQPAMADAVQKKINVIQKLADSGRISLRDKIQAKRAINDADVGLEKAMAGILSPEQIAGYKTATDK